MDIMSASQAIDYYIILFGVGVFYSVAFRKDIYHIFDPMVSVLINFAFSGTLVTWWWFNDVIELPYLATYWGCSILFIMGFKESHVHLTSLFSLPEGKHISEGSFGGDAPARAFDMNHLFVFALFLALINFSALSYSFLNAAVPILSENPELDRVAINAANRWLNVISVSCAPVGLLVSAFLAMYSREKKYKPVCVIAVVVFLANYVAAGSKSAVLILLFLFGVLLIYLNAFHYKVPVYFKRSIYLIVPLGLLYFIFVVSSSLSTDQTWLKKFFTRLALSGEAYFHLFVENQYEALKYTYNFVTYFLHTITAPLGIKLIPYNIGVALYGGSTGDYSGFGPNPQHVGEGIIFWGKYLAPLYSFFIGYLTSFTRLIFLGKPTNVKLIGFIVLFFNALYLPIDVTMWIFNVLSSLVVLTPVYAISKIITVLITQERCPEQLTVPLP